MTQDSQGHSGCCCFLCLQRQSGPTFKKVGADAPGTALVELEEAVKSVCPPLPPHGSKKEPGVGVWQSGAKGRELAEEAVLLHFCPRTAHWLSPWFLALAPEKVSCHWPFSHSLFQKSKWEEDWAAVRQVAPVESLWQYLLSLCCLPQPTSWSKCFNKHCP